jgi:hypothetical protein
MLHTEHTKSQQQEPVQEKTTCHSSEICTEVTNDYEGLNHLLSTKKDLHPLNELTLETSTPLREELWATQRQRFLKA